MPNVIHTWTLNDSQPCWDPGWWFGSWRGNYSQIPECTCSISHNAPFRTKICTFMFWMEHCEIWNRCILGFVKLVYSVAYKIPWFITIRTFGNRCLSAIGGGNRWSRFARWVQLSAEAAWPPRSTTSATLCAQATRRLMIMIYNVGNLHK